MSFIFAPIPRPCFFQTVFQLQIGNGLLQGARLRSCCSSQHAPYCRPIAACRPPWIPSTRRSNGSGRSIRYGRVWRCCKPSNSDLDLVFRREMTADIFKPLRQSFSVAGLRIHVRSLVMTRTEHFITHCAASACSGVQHEPVHRMRIDRRLAEPQGSRRPGKPVLVDVTIMR